MVRASASNRSNATNLPSASADADGRQGSETPNITENLDRPMEDNEQHKCDVCRRELQYSEVTAAYHCINPECIKHPYYTQ